MPAEYHRVISSIIIKPVGDNIYAETVTTVSLDDEAGGAFVKVEQDTDHGLGCVRIDPSEWPLIRSSINKLIATCKKISP